MFYALDDMKVRHNKDVQIVLTWRETDLEVVVYARGGRSPNRRGRSMLCCWETATTFTGMLSNYVESSVCQENMYVRSPQSYAHAF